MAFELILTGEDTGVLAELHEHTPRVINSTKLRADVYAAVGDLLAGISTLRGCVVVNLTGIPDTAQWNTIESIITAHNPSELTAEQQTELADYTDAAGAKAAFMAAYANLTSGWDALDAAQKQTAIRTAVIVCMRLLKFIAKRYL